MVSLVKKIVIKHDKFANLKSVGPKLPPSSFHLMVYVAELNSLPMWD